MQISELICETGHWHRCGDCGETFACHCSDQSGYELCGGDACEKTKPRSPNKIEDDFIDNEIERLRLGGKG